jgi:hypothetical protein
MSNISISLSEVLEKEIIELYYRDEITLTPGSEVKYEFSLITGWNALIPEISVTENPNTDILISWSDSIKTNEFKLSLLIGCKLTRPEDKVIIWFKNNATTSQKYVVKIQGLAFRKF